MGKWEIVNLEKVIRIDKKTVTAESIHSEDIYIGLENIEKGTGKILSYSSAENFDIKSNKFSFTQDHILYGKLRPNLNKVATPDFRGICSTDIFPIMVNDAVADKRYIFHVLHGDGFVRYASNKTNGANLPRVNEKIIKEFTISLPSLDVQKKRAITLDNAWELIELRKKQLEELDNLIKATFYDMFGDPVSNEKGWDVVSIGNFAKVETGSTPNRSMDSYYNAGQIPWVKTGEINGGYISSAEEFITQKALNETNCKVMPENTIVVAMYGQGKTRGKVGLLMFKATTNQACAAVLPNSTFSPEYLLRILDICYNELRSLGRGGNQPNLNLSIIKKFQIIFPPISLQKNFAEIVAKIEEQKVLVKKAIDESQYLFNSLMSEYFE